MLDNKFKYPRTYHFDFSQGMTSDDKIMQSYDNFIGKDIVITEKMDGENTSLYNNGMHARSIDSGYHSSRTWVKNFHSSIAHLIPDGYRICGENLFAKHSIHYNDLRSYFYGFSMWEMDYCLPWHQTLYWFNLLGVTPVPTIYEGEFDIDVIKSIAKNFDTTKSEGFVVRLTSGFFMEDFDVSVAKWVRSGHVDDVDEHWMHKEVVKNILLKGV